MSEINEFQHPDPIWTWKSNKRGGLHEGFRVGLADLLIGLPRTAVPKRDDHPVPPHGQE